MRVKPLAFAVLLLSFKKLLMSSLCGRYTIWIHCMKSALKLSLSPAPRSMLIVLEGLSSFLSYA
jgi:hypothetical protein